MARLTRQRARALCLAMLINPVAFVTITVLLTRYRLPSGSPAWAGKAHIAALVVSAYMIIAPFLLPTLMHSSRERMRARGTDPDALLALAGIGGAVGPVACGLFLVVFGDKVIVLQAGLLVSLVVTGYWYWRERALLFGSRPPVVGVQDPR